MSAITITGENGKDVKIGNPEQLTPDVVLYHGILIEKDDRYLPVIRRRVAEAATPLFDAAEAAEAAP